VELLSEFWLPLIECGLSQGAADESTKAFTDVGTMHRPDTWWPYGTNWLHQTKMKIHGNRSSNEV
jgi:hypothetical protein